MSDTAEPTGFTLKGWHVLAIFVAAFGIIITVNVVMATKAVRTFPGLEVDNTYVFSQEFDGRVADQERLGWTVEARDVGEMLTIAITDSDGRPVRAKEMTAIIGRPTDSTDDVVPQFAYNGSAYETPLAVGEGRWIVRFSAIAEDGTEFLQRLELQVEN